MLGSMKKIVLSVKDITAQADVTSSDPAQTQRIEVMADCLSNLMLASKAHANSKRSGGSSVEIIKEASGRLEETVMILVNACNSTTQDKVTQPSGTALSSFVNKQADKVVESIEEMLEVARTNDFSKRFFACADEIFYCNEDIAKECVESEKTIHPDALQEFKDIRLDLDDSVQKLMGIVDVIERGGASGRPNKQIEKHTFDIAKFIKELITLIM